MTRKGAWWLKMTRKGAGCAEDDKEGGVVRSGRQEEVVERFSNRG